MTWKKYILPFILFFSICCVVQPLHAQYALKNNKAKNATIKNNGVFRIKRTGQVIGMPDTINGRVEFTSDKLYYGQNVPNSTYNQLVIDGQTEKMVDTVYQHNGATPKNAIPLVTKDSLIVKNNTYVTVKVSDIHAKAAVSNNSGIIGTKEVRMNNDNISQTIDGKGQFSNLNIDNPQGVDVIKEGGFQVNKRLELTRGELRNSNTNNFSIKDSAWVIRHSGASISEYPNTDKTINLKYVGAGKMTIGPEIPVDSTKLQNLLVENAGGIQLNRDISVNDTLLIASRITTDTDSTQNVLNFFQTFDPIFTISRAEIDGSIRRTYIKTDGSPILFNNMYTFAEFADPIAAAGITEVTFRARAKNFPPHTGGDQKVERFIQVSAKDADGNIIENGMNMKIGYAWRIDIDNLIDENNNLYIPDLILQRWAPDWADIENSKQATVDSARGWAYSSANISQLGDFAIGLPGVLQLVLNSRIFMEGPYRFGSMAADLKENDLFPKAQDGRYYPPDMYPYNLDPNRNFTWVSTIPDSIVDWIVLEFRKEVVSPERQYRTAFLRNDGKIVDLDGSSPVMLSRSNIDSGSYYIAIRHRNHLAVITENKVSVYADTMADLVDFSKPGFLLGGTEAMKPIGYDQQGDLVWGMIAGDGNSDGKIDDGDLFETWGQRDNIWNYFNQDYKLNGIITTRDLNVSWNNRGRETFVTD